MIMEKKMLIKRSILKEFPIKRKHLGTAEASLYDHCLQWLLLRSCTGRKHVRASAACGGAGGIPRDVPKGHLVVYVGEECKRFVIKVAFLEHPLFMALLQRAQEEYEFTSPHSKLCIPCDENVFLNVLSHICVGSSELRDRRPRFCF